MAKVRGEGLSLRTSLLSQRFLQRRNVSITKRDYENGRFRWLNLPEKSLLDSAKWLPLGNLAIIQIQIKLQLGIKHGAKRNFLFDELQWSLLLHSDR